jgi:hypothetical protein
MPPGAPSGEDTQPNERRLNRKGVTNVPTIRLTGSRRPGRGAFHGRSQSYRGSGPTYANLNQQNLSHPPNQSQFSSRGRVNNLEQYLPRHTHPGSHPAAPNPHTANSATQNTSKRLFPFPDARQPKRPRLETHSQSRFDRPTNSKHIKKKPLKSRIEIKLDLPLHCRTGIYGYRASRRTWLDREIQRVELENKVKIINAQYLDREVLLCCNAEESQNLLVCEDSLGNLLCS